MAGDKLKRVLAAFVVLASASFYGWLIDFERQTDVAGWWGAPALIGSFIGFIWGLSTMLRWNHD